MLDKWDYCLRKLFVLKSTPLQGAVGHLAPGSDVLKSYLTGDDVPPEQRADLKKIIRKMSVEDWAAVVGAFDRWPFAPEELLITDSSAETTVYSVWYDITLYWMHQSTRP